MHVSGVLSKQMHQLFYLVLRFLTSSTAYHLPLQGSSCGPLMYRDLGSETS